MDADRIELSAPLPGNALSAVLTFKASRLGRDREVPRAEATHAELELEGLDGRKRANRLTLEEADAWLVEAKALHARDAAWAAGRQAARDEAAADRAERSAAVRSVCPHCDAERTHEGRRNLVSLGAPEHVARSDSPGLARPETRAYEEYACPRCGSVELFRAGLLDHPLGGR